MAEFSGPFEGLQQMVSESGYVGQWKDIASGKQFRSSDEAILNWYPSSGKLQFQGPSETRDKLKGILETKLYGSSSTLQAATCEAVAPAGNTRVFVVHGHDTTAREQLELILHKLGLEPFVLANTGGGGLTIIEALESEMGPGPDRSRFGIVLMSPDDMGYCKKDGPEKVEPRARQNVVLEMGMLISRLGRANVAILKKGHLESPSDAAGIIYIPFNDHVKETVPRLVDRLRTAGFNIDPACITKASS